MRNIIKNNKSRDVMADIKKNKKFLEYSKNTELRLRLAVEVYNARKKMRLSQPNLAKNIGSTQKVISRIESGEVNLGIEFLNKLADSLNFNKDIWSRIFNFQIPETKIFWLATASESDSSSTDAYKQGALSKVLNNPLISKSFKS